MASYSIRDLEKLSGIKAHTLRIWERRYNLLEPKRTSTNIRHYDDEDLKRIMNIAYLNRNGIKISHIARLNSEEISEKITGLSKNGNNAETQIDNLVISMIGLDEKRFEKVINTSVMQVGFEETVFHTIYPFFEKVGILWQTGSIKPAQEHFVSNLIRQKMILAIDGVIEPEISDPKKFVLFLPEGEYHEIGLLFYYYLIKKEGHKAVYLGQTVPFDDLNEVIRISKSDYLITSFSSGISVKNIEKYISELSSGFPDHKIYFSSFEGRFPGKNIPSNVVNLKSAMHFRELLKNISRV